MPKRLEFRGKKRYNGNMENVKRIVSENLIRLRKENHLTQAELAKRINYSDKAISRWETGEVVPDLETIYALSEVFGVPVSAITEEHTEEENPEESSSELRQKILSQIFLLCEVWLIITVAFVYIKLTRQTNMWQLFAWGVPASAAGLWFFSRKEDASTFLFICATVSVWSLIACVYLRLFASNPWYIFFIGLPVQGLIVIRYVFNYKQNLKKIKIPRGKRKRKDQEE